MRDSETGRELTHEELLARKAANECWVLDDDGHEFWWPFCIVDGCSNKACLRLNSPRCYPHTLPGVPIVAEAEEDSPETVIWRSCA